MTSTPRGHRRVRTVAALTALLLVGGSAAPGPARAATGREAGRSGSSVGATWSASSGTPAGPDPDLGADLDAVMAFSPPGTCLSVAVDGRPAYRHRATEPVVPASTQKLVTATVALDQLGPDTRFATRVVAAAPPDRGVVDGDLTLVGGGDPLVMTDLYRFVRRIGPGRPVTSLDQLADRIQAAGVRRVTGRILGDDSRYDRIRTVATWPSRYVRQEQAGPLSALDVDDGYQLRLPPPGDDAPVRRERAADPAANAARLLGNRLLLRGIQVDGRATPGSGTAPAGAVEVARISSAPLSDIVGEMLLFSDNQTAELLTKEIGRTAGLGGTTEAGVGVINRRARELGIAGAGTRAVDGSGLDPGNRVTCDSLVSVLDSSGGLTGPLGQTLPVAARSGTLQRRFRDTPAEGTLHAKTGSLSGVRALAGFVELPSGDTATFAFVANGDPAGPDVGPVETLLATVLAGYEPPCAGPPDAPLVAPLAPYAGLVGTLAMFPLQSVLVPGAVLPLHVFEDRYKALVDRCVALQEDFGVTLIARGSEVGGGDVRTGTGTRARIVEARQAPDGRWAVVAVGLGRIRVHQWLPDDPYPLAEVTDWPDPPAPSGLDDQISAVAARLRRVLGLRAELGEPGAPPTVDLGFDPSADDPSLASFRLVGLAPVGELDRQRLLTAADVSGRLAMLDTLLAEDEEVCRARLGGA